MVKNTSNESYTIPKFLNSTTKIIIGTALVYFIFAQLSLLVIVPVINIPPFFPGIGFAVAFVLIFGRKAIIGVAIGSFAYSIQLHLSGFDSGSIIGKFSSPLLICLIRPLIACLNTFIVTYLIHFWCKKKYPLSKKTNVVYFTLSALIGSSLSLTLGLSPLTFTPSISFDQIILTWSNWSQSNLLGIILFTPFVLSWFHKTEEAFKWTSSKKIEGFLLIILTIIMAVYVFTTRENNESIIFFLLIWAASRFEMKIITSVILIVTVISVKCTLHHLGGFGWNGNFLMLQLFLFVNITSVLFLKAILKEKEKEESKLKISERNLGLEKNILEATIESPKGLSIYSLDTDLNYLIFNTIHSAYMKKEYGAEIKIGENHIGFITKADRKKEINSIYQNVLKGNIYLNEEKDIKGEYWNVHKSPIKDREGNFFGTITIVTNVSKLKLKLNEIQLEKNNFSLNERIKELHCLFDVSKIISNKTLSKFEKMEACVQIIPQALRFTEIANCRIQFRDKEFFSENYQQNDLQLHQKIIINGKESGLIEVGYFNAAELKKDVFLDEEVKLLETLSDIISKSLETKIAEEKLLKREQKFRSIYENSLDIYFRKDLNGKILQISPSVEKHLHYKQEFMIGKNIKDFYQNPLDNDSFYKNILKEQQIYDYIEQFIDSFGESVYLSVNAEVIYDSNGKPIYIEGTKRNISERISNEKQLLEANEKIKESEERFRAIYESFDDIYFKKDLNGVLLEVSPSVENHFKLKREFVIGKNAYDFYVDRTEGEQFYEALLQNQHINDYEERFVTGNGEIIYFSVNAKVIYDSNGEPQYFEGTMRNVNERIQNRKKLLEVSEKIKESEAKFRSIFENFEDVYFRTTMDGMALDVSPSFEKHFLRPCSDALENSVFDFYYDAQDRKSLLEKLKKEGRVRDSDIRFTDGKGNVVFFSVNARLIYDENREPIFIEKSMRNINDRINTQKEIHAKNRKLEFQNTELEQFAYIASHDLQEPLITVIHCINMLQNELEENLNEDQKQYLNFINSSTSRMQLLVKGLLDYSRIGKEGKTSIINCNEIVAEVLADMSVSLKESNAIIEYGNLPVIEGYTTEIRQLFQNMISNANKYRRKGKQPQIKVAAVKEEHNWLFSIEDNGIGIEEQDMDKVFVIFKRLHNRNEYQGTGIGLSHCKKIIEHHKGKIWVESKFNEGSTFKWTFPLEQN